jgi:hypothetical protein
VDSFSKDVQFVIEHGELEQWRVQLDLDGQVKLKASSREYTGDLSVRWRRYKAAGERQSEFQRTQEFKFEASLGIPIWWRLKLTPAYTWERASIAASDTDVFKHTRLELRLSLPFVLRYGQAGLVN